jgi:uncharacterized membrane protein
VRCSAFSPTPRTTHSGAPASSSCAASPATGWARAITADIEITELTPDRRIAFRTTTGPVRPAGSYELAPSDDGGTRVTFTLSAEVGGIKKLVMGSMVQKTMNSEVGALTELKRVLERRG